MTTPLLRHLVATGLAGQLVARGVPGGFLLVMKNPGGEEFVLAAQRGSNRVFKRLDTLAGFLNELGARCALLELAGWDGRTSDLANPAHD